MAIAYVGSTGFTAGNGTTVTATSKPGGTSIGHVMVASMYVESAGAIGTPTIASTGDTWTPVHNITNTTTTPDFEHYVWIAPVSNASSTITVTWDGDSVWRDFVVSVFSGVDTTTPQDAAATENQGTDTTPTALGIAQVTSGSWLVMCETNFDGAARGSSTLTERHDDGNMSMFAAASSSSANQTCSIASSSWTAIMVRLRPIPDEPIAISAASPDWDFPHPPFRTA